MTSKLVAQLLGDLGVTRTHSRPRVSNDNPYSESQFKTLKYRPGFPHRFGSVEDAQGFCRSFFAWYNREHRRGGIGMMTPEAIDRRRAAIILEQREQVLKQAFLAHPSDSYVGVRGRHPCRKRCGSAHQPTSGSTVARGPLFAYLAFIRFN